MTNKPTLTIGICAYNEEKNIGTLIESLQNQHIESGVLNEILIVDDQSADTTAQCVNTYALSDSRIKLISHSQRLGKSGGLRELYKQAKSDYLITCDADVSMGDGYVCEKILLNMYSMQADLAFPAIDPHNGKNLIQKCIWTYEMFWRDVIDTIDGGTNIHRCLGCCMGLSKKLYKHITIPKSSLADDHFVYLYALKNSFKPLFVRDACVLYMTPATLKDYVKQFSRYDNGRESIQDYFGEWSKQCYIIPMQVKVRAYLKWFRKSPLYMCGAIFLIGIQRLYGMIRYKNQSGIWESITSTK